jgi:hypothetical protein
MHYLLSDVYKIRRVYTDPDYKKVQFQAVCGLVFANLKDRTFILCIILECTLVLDLRIISFLNQHENESKFK